MSYKLKPINNQCVNPGCLNDALIHLDMNTCGDRGCLMGAWIEEKRLEKANKNDKHVDDHQLTKFKIDIEVHLAVH